MANVRVSDTSLWLHNKLGTNNDTWSIGAIYSQLNQDVLRNIKECFVDLQPQVKLKLLLSFLEIPRRSLEEWKLELEEILEIAQEDGEPWVSVLAETLKTVPSTGSLNESICDNTTDETRKMIAEMVADLRKLVRKQAEAVMLPLECSYLNRSALTNSIGQLPQPVRHFTLKRKPKSQSLRADLLQKSADLQNNVKKNPAPTVPLRTRGLPRKMTDTTPLKGIPSKFGFGSLSRLGSSVTTPPAAQDARSRVPARPIAGKKEGGVKLLDINEQPLGYAAMKKRKKQQEIEAAAKAAEAAALVTPVTPEEKKPEAAPAALPTPDYAAGLLPPMTPAFQPPLSPPTPSYAPMASPATPSSSQKTTTRMIPQQPVPQQRVVSVQTQQHVTPMQQMPHQTVLRQVVTVPPQQPQQQQVLLQQQYETQQFNQMPPPAQPVVQQQPVIQQTPQQQPQPQTQKKTVALMLTREQMQEAQEMFRNSNRVTRPEKALILGFMAGSRENPCPHLGNIVTIKLSEDEEIVQQPDGNTVRMVVETHFQMNYNLGEWKRIKKYKKMDPQMAGMLPATVTA